MARVIGIGGVFIKSPDTAALNAWYARVLGLEVSAWGGAMFGPSPAGAVTLWTPFDAEAAHFAPSIREVMVNFIVDDLDGVLARAAAEGVEPIGRDGPGEHGGFAWLMDPDGTKIELWQPATAGDAAA